MEDDYNVFKDLQYLRKKMRELCGPEPIGFKIFEDGTWTLWYGEFDEDS